MIHTDPRSEDPLKDSPAPAGIANGDRLLGLILLILSAFLCYETFFFKTFDWDPVGMAFWPRVLLAMLSLICLWHMLRGSADGQAAEPVTPGVMVWFAGAMGYVLALGVFGFYLSTLAGVTVYSLVLRRFSARNALTSFALAAACTVLVHLIFAEAMNVALPAGFWE